ncbi:MAG: hypothetical protein JWQ23_1856 [Herminiimonas sp.]|nr:hypothetical protein [Herminiimonas sp.]
MTPSAAMEPLSGTLRDMIATHPRRFGLLYAFNYRPADYLHPSQRARFAGAGVSEAIWEEPRARRTLSEFILQTLALTERPCFDLAEPAWPTILLDEKRLLRLARHIGAVILGQHVRRSVARDDVLTWKERMTPEAYKFVMTTASLLPHVNAGPAIDDSMAVDALGFSWINASIAGAPDELLVRARLKLPPGPLSLDVPRATACQVVNTVFSVLEPRWFSSFATLKN